jgi:hypothetical protein
MHGVQMGFENNTVNTINMYGGILGPDTAIGSKNILMSINNTVSTNLFNLMGGNVEANQLLIGAIAGTDGSYSEFSISGGDLNVNSMTIGSQSDGRFSIAGSDAIVNVSGDLVTQTKGSVEFILDGSGVSSLDLGGAISQAAGSLLVDASACSSIGRFSLITYSLDSGRRFVSTNLTFASGMNGYLDYTGSSLDLVLTSESQSYSGWITDYNLTGGQDAVGADPDGDGIQNIYEYGLGGDPTNNAVTGTLPTFEIIEQGGSNICEYIHVQRVGSFGIAYAVQQVPDLGSAAWTNEGISNAGESVEMEGFQAVTNHAPVDTPVKFMRLLITEE